MLVQVTIDGQQVVSQAVGESMTGVPATTDMHFRNGAVAESYMSTLLLMLVDEKKVSLDDNVAKWLPDLPHADDVTLGQFVQMTCGYVDYEQLPEFTAANYAEPFKLWTPKELLSYAVGKPLWYTPGTGLNYAHTKLCDPGVGTGENHRAEPEHRAAGKSPGAVGAARHDRSGGNGRHQFRPAAFPESYAQFASTDLRGKTTPVPGCGPGCFEQSVGYTYGLGVVITGNWLLQDPLFSGESAVEAYLPSQKVAIAVPVTHDPESFDSTPARTATSPTSSGARSRFRSRRRNPPPIK